MESKQTSYEEESFWDLIKGQNLYKANGSVHKADAALADKKLILLYFSANWCQACTEFTPLLRDFYEDVCYRGIEIIFVSSDGCPEDMFKYMKNSHGDWYAVEYGSDLARDLSQKYDVWGIQCSSGLVVLSENGSLITKNGRNAVSEKGPEVIHQWSDRISRSNDIDRYDSDDSDDDYDSKSDTDDLCTFTQTGTSYRKQHWYFCHTCDFEYNEGVCSICVKTCHFNHDVSYAKYSRFFCDCGAKGEKSCQKLVKTDRDIDTDSDDDNESDRNNFCDMMNRKNLQKSSKKRRKTNLSTTNVKDIMTIYELTIATQNKANNKTADTEEDQEYYSIPDTDEDTESSDEDTDTEDEIWEHPKNPIRVQLKSNAYSLPKSLPESQNRFKMLEVMSV